MEMSKETVVSPKVHHTDEVNFWNAEVIRNSAGQSGPSHWIFVGTGSDRNWKFAKWITEHAQGHSDREAVQILEHRILPLSYSGNEDL